MNHFIKAVTSPVSSILVASLFISTTAFADSRWVRLGWHGDASSEATVSFSPDGRNNNPYINYGFSTNENTWREQDVTFSTSLDSITSRHVRLTDLNADSAVYFRLCDDDGCGRRYWFKTAPDDNSPFVFVAGGDTRSGTTSRRDGNRLVAKIRPLFIMHGGDYTNVNNNSEWTAWLNDWELTYSNDTINGNSYRRVYPMVSTHGNHEDDDLGTICKMFGADTTGNGRCSETDTFYATRISPLLRVYTLNSELRFESRRLQNQQNDWLSEDLATDGASSTWRMAQYHRTMFPHSTSKSDTDELFDWWADDFFEYGMNVVVESDTHITKITEAVEPRGDDFAGIDEGVTAGTVYVGEGSWGAPARSANDPKPWTVDLASVQQFKVITVSDDGLDLRTAQFDRSAGTLSRADRENDATALPNNVNWWSANQIGDVLELVQDNRQRSVFREQEPVDGTSVNFSATEDAFIASETPNRNYGSSDDQLLSDESDSTLGVSNALLKWDVSSIRSCATIESASIQINVFNSSSGTYGLFSGENPWSENNVTWNSVNGENHLGNSVGTVNPDDERSYTINLNSNGRSMVEQWLQGDNNGVVISSNGTSDGIDFSDRENGPAARLALVYSEDQCTTDGGEPTADFNFNANQQTVLFFDGSIQSSDRIVSRLWDFGDGGASQQQNPTHSYTESGTYIVNLTVTDEDGDTDSVRRQVTVVVPVTTGPNSEVVTASTSQGANVAANVTDGNTRTRWSANGLGNWLRLEYPEEVIATGMNIAFWRGTERQAFFTLQVSDDGSNWTNVTGDLRSSGNTDENQFFAFEQTQTARFFRYLGNGNSNSNWNSLTKVELVLGDDSNQSPAGSPRGTEEARLDIASATASDNDGNVPANAIDIDPNFQTRWSAFGSGQSITFDLGELKEVSRLMTAWFRGNQRSASYEILGSIDNVTWNTIETGNSSGTTLGLETIDINDTTARYIRIVGFGNTSNEWNSLTDVQIYGLD